MFFDPTTNLFIGDGEPRSTVERPDGSLPGTTQAMVDALPRPVHPRGVAEDAFHIQSYDFVGSATAAGNARREAARTQPSSSTSARAPDAPFQRYFCRCTGRWLARRHNCTQGPMQGRPEQSGAGIAPGSTLPRDWITHKIVVDASVNPEGEVPTRAGSSNVVDPGFQPTGTTSSPAVTDTNVGIPPAASRPAYDGGQLQPIPEIQPEESQAPEGEKKKKNKKKKNKNKKAASSDEPTAEESSTTTTTTTTTTTASTTNLAPISEDTPALITTTTTTTNPTSISEDVPTTTTDDKDNGSDSSSSDDAAEATAAAAAAAVASGEGASSGAKAATHGAHEGPKKAKKGGKKSSGKKGGGKKKGGRK